VSAWEALLALDVRPATHLVLHLLVPALVARRLDKQRPGRAWVILVATMLVDLDHLLADTLYDPDRCSLGFHPLHTWPVWPVAALLTAWPRTRLVGVGLLIHMGLDGIDCLWMGAC
jgi:hypothetical protein